MKPGQKNVKKMKIKKLYELNISQENEFCIVDNFFQFSTAELCILNFKTTWSGF